LGTDVYRSISLFVQNLKCFFSSNDLNLLNTLEIVDLGYKEVRYKSYQLQKRYHLVINNKNITPTTNTKKWASFGTIRQYLQELIAINFINASENERFAGNIKFDILPDLKYFIQSDESIDNNIIRKFINLIRKKGFNHYSLNFEKNLGYSLFLSLLYLYDETRLIIDEINVEYLKPITTRSKIYEKRTPIEKINLLLNNKKEYLQLCTKIKEYIGNFSDFEQIILDEMVEENERNNNCKIDKLQPSLFDYSQLKELIEKGKSKIDNRRASLKINICQNRGYSNKNDLYTDFDNFLGKQICNYHPCHIFEIKSIKAEYTNEIIKLYKNNSAKREDYEQINVKYQGFADDPSNGLLMTSNAHSWFDKYKFGFDFTNGKIWIKKDYDKIIAEA